jgi:N6-adenosine-specific RNA methylase IME4
VSEPETFPLITCDPPWEERGAGKIKRGADKHYKVLKLPDILQAMVRAECWRPAPDCVLVMWSTMMSLEKSLRLMDSLGFKYTTHGVWVKTKIDLGGTGLNAGIGQYFRGAHELYLVGTRGSGFAVKTDDKSIPSVIMAPPPREAGKRKHSRKPTEFVQMIERRFRGPYLEMFARKGDRPSWSYWGDELVPDDDDGDADDVEPVSAEA